MKIVMGRPILKLRWLRNRHGQLDYGHIKLGKQGKKANFLIAWFPRNGLIRFIVSIFTVKC